MIATRFEIEAGFARALLDREQAVPPGLAGSDTPRTRRGFEVYRTNYRVNLQDALQAAFPVTAQLVGEEFFAAVAQQFVKACPPRSPVVIDYGTDLPDFIAEFAPAAAVPYLADVARLESAWNEAYHAAEARSLGVDTLLGVTPEDLAASVVQLHPSARLVCSAFPIAAIWSAHQSSSGMPGSIEWRAEHVLVIRPEAEVLVFVVPPANWTFMSGLQGGASIEQAATSASAAFPMFDPGAALLELFDAGAIIARRPCQPSAAT